MKKTISTLNKISLSIALSSQLLACSTNHEEIYNQGAILAQQKKFEAALQSYTELKEAAGESLLYQYKALFGEAEVYRLKGDLEAQYTTLKKILKNDDFSEHHLLVREKLEENLLSKAQKERLKPDPSTAVPLYKEALKLNANSIARRYMIDYLIAQADTALQDKQIEKALESYKQAKALNQSDETLAKRIHAKVTAAKYSIFKLKAEQLFAAQMKDLMSEKVYDPQTKTFYHKLSTYVEGRVNRKNQEEQLKLAKQKAQAQSVVAVGKHVQSLFALTSSPQVNKAQITVTKGEFSKRSKRMRVNGKRIRVTPFDYHFTIPLEAVYQLAFEVTQADAQDDQVIPDKPGPTNNKADTQSKASTQKAKSKTVKAKSKTVKAKSTSKTNTKSKANTEKAKSKAKKSSPKK